MEQSKPGLGNPVGFEPRLILTVVFYKASSWCFQVEEFGVMVHSLSKSWSSLNPELGYERAFLAVSVKLLVYLSRKVPAVARQIQLVQLINGNREVRGYIETRGGWVSAQGSLKFFC